MYVLLIVICPFVLFRLAIVLSVILQYTNSDCTFGTFKFVLSFVYFFLQLYWMRLFAISCAYKKSLKILKR